MVVDETVEAEVVNDEMVDVEVVDDTIVDARVVDEAVRSPVEETDIDDCGAYVL